MTDFAMRPLLILIAALATSIGIAAERSPRRPPEPLTVHEVIDTCARFYKIPRQVIIGVATLETGMGEAGVGKNHNNLFSIRAFSDWKGDRSEDGRWRKYKNKAKSVEDFCKFIQKNYPHLFGRPVERWLLHGYGNSKFEKIGWAKNF